MGNCVDRLLTANSDQRGSRDVKILGYEKRSILLILLESSIVMFPFESGVPNMRSAAHSVLPLGLGYYHHSEGEKENKYAHKSAILSLRFHTYLKESVK